MVVQWAVVCVVYSGKLLAVPDKSGYECLEKNLSVDFKDIPYFFVLDVDAFQLIGK
mgnify:CR=1 FL=1